MAIAVRCREKSVVVGRHVAAACCEEQTLVARAIGCQPIGCEYAIAISDLTALVAL